MENKCEYMDSMIDYIPIIEPNGNNGSSHHVRTFLIIVFVLIGILFFIYLAYYLFKLRQSNLMIKYDSDKSPRFSMVNTSTDYNEFSMERNPPKEL